MSWFYPILCGKLLPKDTRIALVDMSQYNILLYGWMGPSTTLCHQILGCRTTRLHTLLSNWWDYFWYLEQNWLREANRPRATRELYEILQFASEFIFQTSDDISPNLWLFSVAGWYIRRMWHYVLPSPLRWSVLQLIIHYIQVLSSIRKLQLQGLHYRKVLCKWIKVSLQNLKEIWICKIAAKWIALPSEIVNIN